MIWPQKYLKYFNQSDVWMYNLNSNNDIIHHNMCKVCSRMLNSSHIHRVVLLYIEKSITIDYPVSLNVKAHIL